MFRNAIEVSLLPKSSREKEKAVRKIEVKVSTCRCECPCVKNEGMSAGQKKIRGDRSDGCYERVKTKERPKAATATAEFAKVKTEAADVFSLAELPLEPLEASA